MGDGLSAISVGESRIGLRGSPSLILLVSVAIAAAAMIASLYLATARPYLDIRAGLADDGTIRIFEDGGRNLTGQRLVAIGTPETEPLVLEARDLIEDPDTIATRSDRRIFIERQAALADIIGSPQIVLETITPSGIVARNVLETQPSRPWTSMPFQYWLQNFVGIAGLTLGALVWALRRRDAAAFLFFLTGLGLMLSAVSASVYSTRQLALEGDLFQVLSSINHLGTCMFGTALISLFLIYPRSLLPLGWSALAWGLTFVVWIAQTLRLLENTTVLAYGTILAQFCAIAVLLCVQMFLARKDLVATAALGWFGLSILLGTGIFVFTIAAPVMLGIEPQMSQGYAFGVIFLLYAGLALGVARYRLFDLGTWAFRLGGYMVGAALLIGLDAVLIYVVSMDRIPAFGLALLAVAFVYLPFRNWLGRLVWGQHETSQLSHRAIFEIALSRSAPARNQGWTDFLEAQFHPLTIETDGRRLPSVQLIEEGIGLAIPAFGDIDGTVLRYASHGRRLFSDRDVDAVCENLELLSHAIDSRDAHDRGARTERARIARDLHDNIGAQLLRTLNSATPERKDEIVSETLSDLRDIITNAQGNGIGLEALLSELRYETAERLEGQNIELVWRSSLADKAVVGAGLAHTIRSIVREAATNAMRHAEARTFTVTIAHDSAYLSATLHDDGKGFEPGQSRSGNGIENIMARVHSHQGTLEFDGSQGTTISLRLPVETETVAP